MREVYYDSKYPILDYSILFRIFAVTMDKKIYKKRYRIFCEVLKQERKYHKIKQVKLAAALGVEQSCVSKIEKGIRRFEVIKLMEYCDVVGISLTEFMFRVEGRLRTEGLISPKGKEEYLQWVKIYNKYNNIGSVV